MAYDYWTDKNQGKAVFAEPKEEEGSDWQIENFAAVNPDADMKIHLARLLQQLPEYDRLLLLDKYVDGYTVPELVEKYAQSEDTIKFHLRRAKAKVCEILGIDKKQGPPTSPSSTNRSGGSGSSTPEPPPDLNFRTALEIDHLAKGVIFMNCTDEELAALFSDWNAREQSGISAEREAQALARFKRALEKEPEPEKAKGVAVGETRRRPDDAGFGVFPLMVLAGSVAGCLLRTVLYTLNSAKATLNALGTAKLAIHALTASVVVTSIIGTGLHGPALQGIKNWASTRSTARRGGGDSPVLFVDVSGSMSAPSSNVFNFTTISIAAGTTVTVPKISGPVYWLATGDVAIDGTISLIPEIIPRSVAGAAPTVNGSGRWSTFVNWSGSVRRPVVDYRDSAMANLEWSATDFDARGTGLGDSVLFYYSGHGSRIDSNQAAIVASGIGSPRRTIHHVARSRSCSNVSVSATTNSVAIAIGSGATASIGGIRISNEGAIYDSALSALALLNSGSREDLELASRLLNAGTVTVAATDFNGDGKADLMLDGRLHNGYMGGDIALASRQITLGAIDPELVPRPGAPSHDDGIDLTTVNACSVVDGASRGNDAFTVLALLAAYERFDDPRFLDRARALGDHIYERADLNDAYGGGFDGYGEDLFVGSRNRVLGKSTENNADLYTAFSKLALATQALGKTDEANSWNRRAQMAGDFVIRMYDPVNGRFYAGTVSNDGREVIAQCDSLDAQTYSVLALAASPRYQGSIDWRRPVQYVRTNFTQSVTADAREFHGFRPSSSGTDDPKAIVWGGTARAVMAMRLADKVYGSSRFEPVASFYVSQLRNAQRSAPFGDGLGIVGATLQTERGSIPVMGCISTGRAGTGNWFDAGATAWAALADQGVNPLNPLHLTNANATEQESGRIAKVIRATTGISISDIQSHGLLGGENSFLRKNLGLKW